MTATPPTDICALLGNVKPAADDLITALAQSVHDRRTHEHPTGNEDWFCNNLSGWAGDRMAVVLRRLLDAEAEVDRLRAELATARAAAFSEAVELLRNATCSANETDGMDAAVDVLLAARAAPDAR